MNKRSVNIGEKLQTFRVLKGLTQQQVAIRTGLTQAAISQIEDGKRYPSGASLLKFSKGLELSVDELFSDAP